MLVLTVNKGGDFIQIGDNVRIHIVAINGGQVRIAFDAPKEVIILREAVVRRNENDK
jgi:carbon storage regulator